MKNPLPLVAVILVLMMAGRAQATLIDRGNGLIYDTVLNITWLQDANYAFTSGQDADGLFNWADANIWAANLDYQGFDDWRLPYASVTAGAGLITTLAFGFPCDGSGGVDETACRDNEMAYNFYYNLGGSQSGNLTGNQGPFTNIQSVYWSGTGYDAGVAWGFGFVNGVQVIGSEDLIGYGWAVRPGDVASVPEPGSEVLMGMGLLGLGLARRRRGR